MADRISPEHRSWNMSRIRGRDTRPEKIVRSVLHRLGYRFRLHPKGLPGRPDIVLPKYRTAIFVHGCFWHRHLGCRFAYTPKSRHEFWLKKFDENVARDERARHALAEAGWNVMVIWECEVDKSELFAADLHRTMQGRTHGVDPHTAEADVRADMQSDQLHVEDEQRRNSTPGAGENGASAVPDSERAAPN